MSTVWYETTAERIGVLRINRPDKRNALSLADQDRFADLIDRLAGAPPRVLIITGTGSAFVAGGDLAELAHQPDQATGARLNRVMGAALEQLTTLPCPVIGAVNGDAVGGGLEILTACDLRLAVPQASFHFAQVRVGLTTGWGGCGRLIYLLGQSRAAGLLLTGRTISAQEALHIGLLHRVTPAETEALPAALTWAQELLLLPAGALSGLKQLLWQPAFNSLHEVREVESTRFLALYGSPDHTEALQAFREKRTPRFNRS